LLSSGILLFDGTILPSRPARAAAGARSGCQGWPVFRATAAAARSVLDGREHDGNLERDGAPVGRTHRTSHQKPGAQRHQNACSCSAAAIASHSRQLKAEFVKAVFAGNLQAGDPYLARPPF
jgi:hypothetical protein